MTRHTPRYLTPAHPTGARRLQRWIAGTIALAMLSGCTAFGGSGPSTGAVKRAYKEGYAAADIQVMDLDSNVIQRVRAATQSQRFAQVFGSTPPTATVIGSGDILDVAVWEAPPAVLFGATSVDPRLAANPMVAQSAAIPQQMVSEEGTISVPFVGQLAVRGRTPQQVERLIIAGLAGRAHAPQAVVRVVQNDSRAVTILGEVAASRRMPLTGRGERLLDALAAAGGTRQPVGKMTVQLARGGRTAIMPLETIIAEPAQNVTLAPGDVVTALFQPFSFIALGAVAQNAEVPFEGGGLSLAQALGRIGGLRDDRASVHGVFIFRLEDPAALAPEVAATARRTADGRIPVIYRLDMSNGTALFAAQDFQIRNRDVLYVSNAPLVDFQKFLNTVSNAAFSIIGIGNALN